MHHIYKKITANKKYMVLLDQVVFSGTSFITTLLLTRILGLSNFGIFASVILIIYLIISVLSAIIIQPFQVNIARVKEKEQYISFSFILQITAVLLIAVTSLLLLNLNLSIFRLYREIIVEIFFLATVFVLHDYFRKLFLATIQIEKAFIIDAIVALMHVSLLLLIIFNFHVSLPQILIYLSVGYIPSILVSVYFIKPTFISKSAIIKFGKIHYNQSKWLVMTAFIQWWSSNLFVVASGVFLGLKMLGVFRFVQSLFGVLNILLQTFENYVLPQTSQLLIKSQQQAKKYIQLVSIKTAIPFGLLLLILFVFSKPIIILAGGEDYAPYDYVIKGMAILYAVIFIGAPVRMAIRTLILNKNFFVGYLISLAFSLLSFNYIIEKGQLIGVISGLLISQILVITYWFYVLHKNNFSLWK